MFMFGTSFKKRDAALAGKFETITVNQGANELAFLFPKASKFDWNGDTFSATFPNKKGVNFQLSVNKLSATSFDQFIDQTLINQTISTKGNRLSKNLRGGIWTEQSIFTSANGQFQQHLLIFFQDPIKKQQMQAVLTSPYGEFTTEMQEVVMYLQRSVGF